MSVGTYLVFFAVAAAALAAWVDARFPRLHPESLQKGLIHMGAAIAIGQLVTPVGIHVLTGMGSPSMTIVAVVGVGLPALTYSLLAALWLMKLLRNSLGGAHR